MARTSILKKKPVLPSATRPVAAPAAGVKRFKGQLRSEQFREHLVREFAHLSPGARVASERELARESGLSLLTVNKVLATLATEGLVERRRGQGTFVAERKAVQVVAPSGLKLIRFIARDPERILVAGSRNYLASFYKGVREAASADGYEVILGCSPDEQFGPVILVGTGGQLVEVYGDRALALPPLNSTLAIRLMEQTKIYRALQGVRGGRAERASRLRNRCIHPGSLHGACRPPGIAR